MNIQVRPSTERAVDAMLAKMDRAIAEAFAEFIRTATSEEAIREVVRLISEGRVEEAITFITGHSAVIGHRIAEAYRAAGEFEVEQMRAETARNVAAGIAVIALLQSFRPARPVVAIRFDPVEPTAAAAIREIRDNFLRTFTADQRDVIADIIARGIAAGDRPTAIGRRIRAIVGLSRTQAAALDRYRIDLDNLDPRVLTAITRDRRHDPRIRRAIETGTPLTADEIERIVASRTRRMIIARGNAIARNEAAAALNQGREEGLRQMIEASGIPPGSVVREWRSMRDARVRHTHTVLDGQRAGLNGVFVSPSGAILRYPHDPRAPAHETIGCRCYLINRIRRPR